MTPAPEVVTDSCQACLKLWFKTRDAFVEALRRFREPARQAAAGSNSSRPVRPASAGPDSGKLAPGSNGPGATQGLLMPAQMAHVDSPAAHPSFLGGCNASLLRALNAPAAAHMLLLGNA